MIGMSRYYISRAVISAAFGLLLAFAGFEWRIATLGSITAFVLFLLAPRSGRYTVHPELGITALQRDERTQAINDKAARNAFIVTMLAIAGVAMYFGSIVPANVPVIILHFMLALGMLSYFVSDFWLRRS